LRKSITGGLVFLSRADLARLSNFRMLIT